VQPGFYRLHEHMQATLALDLLLSPSSIVSYRVLIPEGFTLGQLLYRVSSDTHIPFRQLLSHALHPTGLTVPAQCHHQMEGCLFPATYDVAPNATAAGVLQLMLTRFQQASTAVDLAAGARRLGYSPFQVLIVASLLEREARFTPDFGKVARVIYNRLHLGMALQLDSTVLYALHENKLLVTYQDTKVPSRYNTYLHTGLPPTPIDSPGTVALQAALHPTPGRWLYFVAVDLAGHDKFTTSYSTFLRLKAEANRNRGGG
jgi:UPF0755 protein